MAAEHADTAALITGGTQGLGLAVAERLVREGCTKLVVVGRDEAKGQRAAASLRELGCSAAHFYAADLAAPDAGSEVVAAAVGLLGRINALANCAADTSRAPLGAVTAAAFDRSMGVNARAPLLATQALAQHCRAQQMRGAVVNIGSIAWRCGPADLAPYSASKAALVCLTRNLAHACRPALRVNCVNVGWMDTPAEDRVQREWHGRADGWLAEVERAQPFGSLVKPEQVARQVALLLSPSSGVVTGAVIDWDQHVLDGAHGK